MRKLLLLAALGSACASGPSTEVHRAEGFSIRADQPLRIAILPIRDAVPGHGIFYWLGRPFAWLGRVVTLDFSRPAPTSKEEAATIRSLLAARLQGEGTAIVNPSQVDASLETLSDSVNRDDITALAKALDVDAIMDGEIHRLGASWFLFVTRREMACSVRLRSGTDGTTLFSADVALDNSAGLDHGPTGLFSLVAAPLAAADTGPYTDMAIAWAEEVGRSLLGTSLQSHDAARPSVVGVEVKAPEGALGAGAEIEVLAKGTTGFTAHFDLGTLHREIPMLPSGAADDGFVTYRGFYHVRAGDRVREAPVIVHFVRPGGGEAWRRSDRLLEIDTSASASGATPTH